MVTLTCRFSSGWIPILPHGCDDLSAYVLVQLPPGFSVCLREAVVGRNPCVQHSVGHCHCTAYVQDISRVAASCKMKLCLHANLHHLSSVLDLWGLNLSKWSTFITFLHSLMKILCFSLRLSSQRISNKFFEKSECLLLTFWYNIVAHKVAYPSH